MKQATALCIAGLLAVSLAPEAFARRAYHGGAYGYQGGTYNIGTTAVTPGYMGWGAAAAGAAVGATVNACAASTYSYDPAPYFPPYGY